jgi:hypothetical protein
MWLIIIYRYYVVNKKLIITVCKISFSYLGKLENCVVSKNCTIDQYESVIVLTSRHPNFPVGAQIPCLSIKYNLDEADNNMGNISIFFENEEGGFVPTDQLTVNGQN